MKHYLFTVLSIVIGLSIYTAWQIAYGQTVDSETGTNISFAYDNTSGFIISDVSVKRAGFGNIEIIGIIQNNNSLNEGVSLAIQMYDKQNHLIDVETGHPQTTTIPQNTKTGFKVPVYDLGSDNILNLDHIYMQIIK
jgi:hypothetical protein